MLGQADIPLAIIYVPDEFEQAEQFRSHMRGLSNVSEIPLPDDDRFASLAVLRAFGEGRAVALQGDRDFRDSGVELSFFGVKTRFPTGPFHLARMTGAVLLPTFIAYAPDLRFEVVHGATIAVARTADRDADVRAAMQQWVATLEDRGAPVADAVVHLLRLLAAGRRGRLSRVTRVATAQALSPLFDAAAGGVAAALSAVWRDDRRVVRGALGGRDRFRQGALPAAPRRARARGAFPRYRDRGRVFPAGRAAPRPAPSRRTSCCSRARRSISPGPSCRAASHARCISTFQTPGRSSATVVGGSSRPTPSTSFRACSLPAAGSISRPTSWPTARRFGSSWSLIRAHR